MCSVPAAAASAFAADDPFAGAGTDPFAAALGGEQMVPASSFEDGRTGIVQSAPAGAGDAEDPFAFGASADVDPFASAGFQGGTKPGVSADIVGQGDRDSAANLLDLGVGSQPAKEETGVRSQPVEQVPESVACEVKLDLDMTEILHGVGEEDFKSCIIHDISTALDIAPAALAIKGIRAGSVIVDLEISRTHLKDGTDPLVLVDCLKQQAADPNSSLRSGVYTCRVQSVTAASTLQQASPPPPPLDLVSGLSDVDQQMAPSISPPPASASASTSSSPPQRQLPGVPPGRAPPPKPTPSPPKPTPSPPAALQMDTGEVDSDEERLREQQMMIRLQQQVGQQAERQPQGGGGEEQATGAPDSPQAQAPGSADPFAGDPFALLAASPPAPAPLDSVAPPAHAQDPFSVVQAPSGEPTPVDARNVSDDPFTSDPFGALMAQETSAPASSHSSSPRSHFAPGEVAATGFDDDPFATLALSASGAQGNHVWYALH